MFFFLPPFVLCYGVDHLWKKSFSLSLYLILVQLIYFAEYELSKVISSLETDSIEHVKLPS